MIRKVGGSGAGEFAVGSGDEPPFMQQAKHVSKAMKEFKGDTYQGIDLSGRVDPRFQDPSNINSRLLHND